MIMVGKFAWSAAPLITPSSSSLYPDAKGIRIWCPCALRKWAPDPEPSSRLRINLPLPPHERRWQRVEIAIVLRRARPHQEGCFIVPLVIEDVNARVDRQVRPRLLQIAAHLVVQMGVGAPAGRADGGHHLALPDGLS